MQAYQIIAGFSDIKSELRTKAKIKKPLAEIQLWFSQEDGVLYVHDFHDHEKNIILSVLDTLTDSWRIYLDKERPGGRLIRYIFSSFPRDQVKGELNELYKLYGYF